MPDSGNEAQMRIMLDHVAEAAATSIALKLKAQQLGEHASPVTGFNKWFATAIAGLGSAALIGLGIWLVSSVSTMSETLARMDERMKGNDTSVQSELTELRRRVTAVELYHQEGGR
jgi:hypothetical protein